MKYMKRVIKVGVQYHLLVMCVKTCVIARISQVVPGSLSPLEKNILFESNTA